MNNPTPEVNRLKKLYQFGQSPWYDNIDRRLIENGELKAIFEKGVVGVTSNPTIFEKAVNSSNIYDEKIRRLKSRGLTLEAVYDELTADDVRDAADMLKSVYEHTKGVDGYVSIEVLPVYAYDPFATIEYARMIFKKVGRPNIMIKVPGTKESPTAIRALISEGINVNVTLLFSVDQYARVALAYLEGVADRMRRGLDMACVSSVASVFVSRIDSKVDVLLENFAAREHEVEKRDKLNSLKGKVAVANIKMIYQKFKEIFSDKNFSDLRLRGARVQRPLWASTGTKNPSYGDCLYVDSLIGPKTVNTMPHATMEAFIEHGRVSLTLENDVDYSRRFLSQAQDLGIDLNRICEDAQSEGVRMFQLSFENLMKAIEAKIKI